MVLQDKNNAGGCIDIVLLINSTNFSSDTLLCERYSKLCVYLGEAVEQY